MIVRTKERTQPRLTCLHIISLVPSDLPGVISALQDHRRHRNVRQRVGREHASPPAAVLSRVDQHVAIGMATARSAATRLKDSRLSAMRGEAARVERAGGVDDAEDALHFHIADHTKEMAGR